MGACIVSYVAALFYKVRFFPALTLDYVGKRCWLVINTFLDKASFTQYISNRMRERVNIKKNMTPVWAS